ncbi:helix-turn-helix domain-containing protein [Niallia sp. Man26]|uniref:helix-turn-helix domain-containing protein n=1 Tax=Niallia sp. Man26 TaxID=2912824 RepID=UPI001EDBF2FF|nr:helix-turn-helix domain-containing protein [Niallia sp. Man26]UPO91045.1 AraC family transcriptional regulator [Niallia sp. Man26]
MIDFHIKLPNVKFLQISGQNWCDSIHTHDDVYQISIPIKGQLNTVIENKETVISCGQSIIANPLSVHGHQINSTPSSFLIIGFKSDVFNNWAKENFLIKQEIEFSKEQNLFINDLQSNMKLWLSPYLFNDNQFSNTFLYDLENTIFNYLFKTLRGSQNNKEIKLQLLSDTYLNTVLDFIHSNYTREITIEHLSQISRQSKYHFLRTFKKTTNYTPHQYILILRINKGKELLKKTNKTILEIANEVGFSSETQFYRNFVKLMACTPSKYRKQL